MRSNPAQGQPVITDDLTQVDELLRSDTVKYYRTEGTKELYSMVANLGSDGCDSGVPDPSERRWYRLAAEPGGGSAQRHHDRAARPDATRAAAITDLEQAQRISGAAAAQVRAAHGSPGPAKRRRRHAPTTPSLTVVRE